MTADAREGARDGLVLKISIPFLWIQLARSRSVRVIKTSKVEAGRENRVLR